MIKHLLFAALVAGVSTVALAESQDNLALSPGEEAYYTSPITTANGATEDPNAPASGTARAYWHGLQNGRAAQKAEDQVNLPPLPPDPPNGYSGYPKAAQVQSIPQPTYAPVPQQRYVQAPQPQYREPQPPVVVNVMPPDPRYYQPATDFGRAPSWRNRQDAMEEYGYDPYPPPGYAPPPRPVYIAPAPVYVQRAVPVYPGYVVRSQPRYYDPYDHGYARFGGRNWSVTTGW